jgi:hypothetical protein
VYQRDNENCKKSAEGLWDLDLDEEGLDHTRIVVEPWKLIVVGVRGHDRLQRLQYMCNVDRISCAKSTYAGSVEIQFS